MVLANQAQVRRRRHAEQFGGGTDGELLAGDDPKLPLVHREAWSSELLAFAPGAAEARLHALHDQAALELGDGRDDGEDRLPQRRARVDLLAEADELDAEMTKEFQRLD